MAEPRNKSATKCEGLFFFVGIVLVLASVALVVSRFPQKTTKRSIENNLVVRPNSSKLNAWKHPTTQTYVKFYVFNVTNGDAIVRGEKPVLEEHGPYTYRMMSPRFNITFYPNDTVAFRNNYTLHFEPNLSAGLENDLLFHINMGQKMVESEDIIAAHTAKQIIFGYDDPMPTAASDVMSLLGRNVDPVFGPFHGFNNSDDGLFLVKTGAKNFKEFNVIERWNGETHLPYWSNTYANMLNGTDGSFLRPEVHPNESRYLYFPQMRRSLRLEYEENSCVKGVDTLRYHFAENLLENASGSPDNIGFCVPEDHCYESGLLNVGAYGGEKAPVFLSLPHFYHGSERLKDLVVGLAPNKTLHDSFFHVEPMTGAVMLGQRRFQINVRVTHVEYLDNFGNTKPAVFPYLWVSSETTVDDAIAKNLRMAVAMVAFAGYVCYIVIAIGIIMLVTSLWRRWRRIWRRCKIIILKPDEDKEPLIPEESADVNNVRTDAVDDEAS